MALLSQFKFPSPFARAYLHSPQLVQEALEAFNIGPFQADGELLCMCFLQPSDDPSSADGVGSRPWEAFRRVLEDLREHTDQTQSVIPSEQWKEWFLGLDEKVPTLSRPENMVGNITIEKCGNLGIDRHLSPSFGLKTNQKKNCGNIGPTDSLAIWPLMRRTSQRWQP